VTVLAALGIIAEVRRWRAAGGVNFACYTALALSTAWGMLTAALTPEPIPLPVVVQGVPLLLVSMANLFLYRKRLFVPK